MRLRRYLTWTLVVATVLSLLLHFFTIFGEPIYGFIEALLEPEAAIRKTTRKLAEQSLDEEDLGKEEKKAKAKPLIDKVTVYLVPAAQLQRRAAAGKPAAVKKAKPASKPKKPKLEPIIKTKVEPANTQIPGALAELDKPLPPPEPPKPEPEPPKPEPPKPEPPPEAEKPKVEQATVQPSPRRKGTYQPGDAKRGFPRHMRVKMQALGTAEGYLEWQREGGKYKVTIEGGAFGKRVRAVSSGDITPQGLHPKEYYFFKDDMQKPDQRCLFDWDKGIVEYGKSNETKTESIDENALDPLSFIFQFAAFGSKMKDFSVHFCFGRDVVEQTLLIKGEAELFVGSRYISTLVITGENKGRKAEVWLAPDFSNAPVKVYFDNGKIAPIPLVATELEIDGKTLLAPQKALDPDAYSGGG